MVPARHPLRSLPWLVWLTAFAAFPLSGYALANGGGIANVCKDWPQNRLIAEGLRSRRFMLEAAGEIQPLPASVEVPARMIFHRTFSLSLDLAEPLALFGRPRERTCFIARDREENRPLRIPVFFVGRPGQSPDDLQADAERAAFAPSDTLGDREDFSEVRFYLRKGSWSFNDVRPFFVCGKPGVMVCEGYCPGDASMIAESLVNAVVRKPAAAAPPARRETARAQPSQAPSGEPALSPQSPPSAARAPATFANPPLPATPRKRLVLAFERKSGAPIGASEVLDAEGSIYIGGEPLIAAGSGLAAVLPEDAFAKAAAPEALRSLFPHFQILDVRSEGARAVLTAEPMFVRASGLTIKISGARGEPAGGCDLTLDVSPSRRVGRGWSRIPLRGLRYREKDASYVLDPPWNVNERELLIGTAGSGAAAELYNTAPSCALESKAPVTVEELRGGLIARSLREKGTIFIAVVSTDSEFSERLDPVPAAAFWSGALGLARSVSEGQWVRKLLARAQFPGPGEETGILEDRKEGRLADGASVDLTIKTLSEASLPKPWPLAVTGSKPIERYLLDLALEAIRADAGLPGGSLAQPEALLLLRGSIDRAGSYFCRNPLEAVASPSARPQWVSRAQGVFALEVWSEAEAADLQRRALAKPAEGAPGGIYLCKGSIGKIALYGLVPKALSEETREGVFAYLTAQAKRHLEPAIPATPSP